MNAEIVQRPTTSRLFPWIIYAIAGKIGRNGKVETAPSVISERYDAAKQIAQAAANVGIVCFPIRAFIFHAPFFKVYLKQTHRILFYHIYSDELLTSY